jgi:tRNA pseudouridine38-40 synthase
MSENKRPSTIKLTLEYNGSGFSGWQEQPGLRTIQGELHRVLKTILREPALELTASGRTDSGVHALGQVVSFKTFADPEIFEKIPYGVTSLLRGEVSVLGMQLMPPDFNARFSKHLKQYSYRIFRRRAAPILEKDFVWHVPKTLDLTRMQEATLEVLGQHDFTSLRSSDCVANNPIRTVDHAELVESGNEIVFRIVARGFLKQMVRNIVGTIVGIGTGKIALSMKDVIAAKDRAKAGMTAPARGLTLDWVRYETDIDEEKVHGAKRIFHHELLTTS